MNVEKNRIAKRVAQEIKEGYLINLGIGLPTLVSNFIGDKHVTIQSENGMVDMGPEQSLDDPTLDRDISNAGGHPVQVLPGGAFFDTSLSFTIIRGGHVDVTVLGAFEVDEQANIASYLIPGKMIAGMGGAMDLVVGSKKVIIAMLHTNKGKAKILQECTLPLTAQNSVDMIVTDMGVFEYLDQGLTLIERHKDFSVEDITQATDAHFHVQEPLAIMED